MGLLEWFRRHGASRPGDHGAGVPPGSSSEGPPVGLSDPGSLSGEDAEEVVAADEGDELAR